MNVGSGGGAAAAPAAGGAAAGGAAAAEETKVEEKEEGTQNCQIYEEEDSFANTLRSQGGVGRGYGFRSFRLERSFTFPVLSNAWSRFLSVQHLAGRVVFHR